MPPSAQPVAWRAVEACKDALAAMDSTAYFHPPTTRPDGVVMCRVVEPPLLQYLDNLTGEVNAIYGVWTDTRTVEPESGLGGNTFRAMVVVQAFVRYQKNDAPFEVADEPEKIRAQLEHDIRKVVESEQGIAGGDMLGGIAERWEERVVEPLFAGALGTAGWVGVHYESELWFHSNLGDPTAQGQT